MSKKLAKRLASIKPGTLLAGLDLALDQNVVVVINQQGQRLARFTFPNRQEGYEYHRRRLHNLCQHHQAPEVLVGMEPTNYYWKLVAADLERHQVRYRLVNAYTVKKHREGDQLDRAKDDPRDAFTVADLLRTGKFTDTQLLSGLYAELRQYGVLYSRLQKEMGREKTLLGVAVGQLFPELVEVFKDFSGATASSLLYHHAAAAHIRTMSATEFITAVRADHQGQRLQVTKLGQAYALAAHSVGLAETEALQLMARLHLDQLSLKQNHLQQAKNNLIDTFLSLPEAPYLLSIGLGRVTAAIILAEIGDPGRYRRAEELVKLAGIQPTPNHSGRKTRSATPMSGKGRARLRTALYFACLRLIQDDQAFGLIYQHLQQRAPNPLTKMQAIGLLMNKLLHILWALIRQQAFYDPTRLNI